MVPALASRLPALDAAMPMALASRPASSPSRCPAATAAPSGPAAPGGWKSDLARLELSRRLPDPALHLHALDERGQHLAAAQPACLRQREGACERGGQRMVRRAPHRLEVEHVHGRAVERRCRHRVEAEAVADRRRLWRAALLLEVRGKDMDRLFLGAGDGDGDAVEHQPSRGRDRRRAEACIVGAGNPLTQLRRHRHA